VRLRCDVLGGAETRKGSASRKRRLALRRFLYVRTSPEAQRLVVLDNETTNKESSSIPLPALLAVCFAALPQDSTCDQYKAISHHIVASKLKEAERGGLLSSEVRLRLTIRAIEGPRAATQRLDPES
jgi:hypothetical protein